MDGKSSGGEGQKGSYREISRSEESDVTSRESEDSPALLSCCTFKLMYVFDCFACVHLLAHP